MRIAAIILAAGEGQRMGGAKALALLRGETFLAHAVRLLANPDIAERFLVTGAERDRVENEAARFPDVRIAHNRGWRDGMLGSVLTGLAVAEEFRTEAVLVHPVDHPFVRPETVHDIVNALARGAAIAVPIHGARRGHPVGFSASVWPDLRAADPAQGARVVLACRAALVHAVPSGPECLWGVNTADDLAAFQTLDE